MHRLGYTRYVAQGGDCRRRRHRHDGRQAPAGLAGIYLNFLRRPPPDVTAPVRRRACPRRAHGGGTRGVRCVWGAIQEGLYRRAGPVTTDDRLQPDRLARLAAWMLDHDTDSYDKISRTFALAGSPPAA